MTRKRKVRTTIDPGRELEVDQAEYSRLKEQGLLLPAGVPVWVASTRVDGGPGKAVAVRRGAGGPLMLGSHTIRTTIRPDEEITVDDGEYQSLLDLHLVYDGTPPDPVADPFDARVAEFLAVDGSSTQTAIDEIITGSITGVQDPYVAGVVANQASATYAALRAAFVAHGPPPSAGDSTPALQAALDAFGEAGGTLLLPDGTYLLRSQLTVPNKVIVRGQGRSATILKADPAHFPTGGSVVQLGPTDPATYGFGCRLENLTVDASGIASTTAVHSSRLQEMSGIFDCVLSGFTVHGFHAEGAGNADFGVSGLEVYPSGAATYGIYYESCGGTMRVRASTVGVSGSLVAGIYAKSTTFLLDTLHLEECTDGVLIDAAAGAIITATGKSTTDAIMANLIRMLGNSRYVMALGLAPNGAAATIKDEFFGVTLLGYVPLWAGGDMQVARLHHYGDQASFFGATLTGRPTVTGSRGGNAALASLLTALATLGLIGDSTS